MPSASHSAQQASFKEHLAAHAKWRSRAVRAVHDLRAWLRASAAGTPDTDARLRRALASIESDQLTIAVAGTDQRGKTELINALFFADFGRRLLPVTAPAERCPLEIQWQLGDGDACLRLLPIDDPDCTEPLAALKAIPERWVRLPLHPQEPEQVNAALAEVYRTKALSPTQASRLGLSVVDTSAVIREVPCWRYALLSIPHPLLKKGLVLLDLPGLAATARDPALHRELMARTDALLMTIAADRGLEAEDLGLWHEHLCHADPAPKATLVALTRKDLLLVDHANGGAGHTALVRATANALGVDRAAVHLVSARDGLAAKIADKPARLRASGIDTLESALGGLITSARRRACRAVIEDNAGELLRTAVATLERRTADTVARIEDLQELDARSTGLVAQSLECIRRDEQDYVRGVQLLQQAQSRLSGLARGAPGLLRTTVVEQRITQARQELHASWHTAGLRRSMRSLFDELRCIVARACTDTAVIAGQVQATYTAMRREAGIAVDPPPPFAAGGYRVEMDLLHAEALRFIRGAELVLTPRGVAIGRFERRLVRRAMLPFEHLRADWDQWLQRAFAPLVAEVERRKARAERRLSRYQRIKATREDAKGERAALMRERVELAKQLTLLRNIRNALEYEPGIDAAGERAPYLATSGGEPVRRSG
jgi:hypothetical protein